MKPFYPINDIIDNQKFRKYKEVSLEDGFFLEGD